MKRIVITTALALSLAAPAFADANQYTNAQIAELHFAASETGSDARVYFGDNNGHSVRAAEIFAQIDAEDTGTRGLPVLAGKVTNLSSKGSHNAVATRIFAEILASENGAER